jgi:hypothetical protein
VTFGPSCLDSSAVGWGHDKRGVRCASTCKRSPVGTRSPAVRDLTDQLIDRERADLKELKELQKDIRDLRDTTLWSLLVDLMQRDTDKHIAILRFVQTHT